VAGISFAAIFVRLALPAPPVTTGFYRMLFASALVLAWLVARGRPLRGARSAVGAAVLGGACFGTDLALWHTSIVRTSVATATLLVNTTPLYVGLYAFAVRREPLDARFLGGAALALLGTAVLLGRPDPVAADATGALLALAAALFYAGYLLLLTAARRGLHADTALFWASASAAAVLGLYGVLGGDAFRGFPLHSWLAFAGVAVVTQVGGVVAIVWALRFLPATLSSVALLGQPVMAAGWAWVLLAEPVGLVQALGGAAVLAGIALASRSQSASAAVRGASEGAAATERP